MALIEKIQALRAEVGALGADVVQLALDTEASVQRSVAAAAEGQQQVLEISATTEKGAKEAADRVANIMGGAVEEAGKAVDGMRATTTTKAKEAGREVEEAAKASTERAKGHYDRAGRHGRQAAVKAGQAFEETGLQLRRLVDEGVTTVDELRERLGEGSGIQQDIGLLLEGLSNGETTAQSFRDTVRNLGGEVRDTLANFDIQSKLQEWQRFVAEVKKGAFTAEEILDELDNRSSRFAGQIRDAWEALGQGGADALAQLRDALDKIRDEAGDTDTGIQDILDQLEEEGRRR